MPKNIEDSQWVSKAISFNEFVSKLAKNTYLSIFPPKLECSLDEAQKNMSDIAKSIQEQTIYFDHMRSINALGEKSNKDLDSILTTKEKIDSQGEHFVSRKKIGKLKKKELWATSKQYDLKGIIPIPGEKIKDFVYRGNTLLFIHNRLKSCKLEPLINIKDRNVSIDVKRVNCQLVNDKHMKEAVDRIPYHMDLSWVAAYIKPKHELMVPALGLTFALPQFNGFNFIHMRDKYKSKELYMNVLAHEITHAGTVYLDSRVDYLETKAYSVGKSSALLGEHVVAMNANPRLWMKIAQSFTEHFLRIPIPNLAMRVIPKIKSAIEIQNNKHSYQQVENDLVDLYGNSKGQYILGRLSANEIEEMRDTNNIEARIDMKDDLKWRLIAENSKEIFE